ncbi:DUF362 domain-containing protein [Verrucomicrobiota bacterium sgz303538]
MYQTLHGQPETETFVHKVPSYDGDIRGALLSGLGELEIAKDLKGKRILIKPNLVEPHAQAQHINTHPAVVRAAVEAFLSLGAAEVAVGEAPGHRTDSLLVLEESGLAELLVEDKIRFHDLNYDSGIIVPNRTMFTRMRNLTFPETLAKYDLLVSLAKMKTHHWAGATLSMKNLFGIMPGVFYGWPKNVFHMHGIPHSICDINGAMPPQLAIVDGIIGMEGDGPIMGDAKHAGVIVMGRNAPAVDATCCRIMGIDPQKIPYLGMAAGKNLGPIAEAAIEQRGELLAQVRTDFRLIDTIEAHKGIRLV